MESRSNEPFFNQQEVDEIVDFYTNFKSPSGRYYRELDPFEKMSESNFRESLRTLINKILRENSVSIKDTAKIFDSTQSRDPLFKVALIGSLMFIGLIEKTEGKGQYKLARSSPWLSKKRKFLDEPNESSTTTKYSRPKIEQPALDIEKSLQNQFISPMEEDQIDQDTMLFLALRKKSEEDQVNQSADILLSFEPSKRVNSIVQEELGFDPLLFSQKKIIQLQKIRFAEKILRQVSADEITVVPSETPVKYDISNEEHLKALEQSQNITYIRTKNPPPLEIGPLALIPGQSAAYAIHDIKEGEYLGSYVGEKKPSEKNPSKDNAYVFTLSNGKEIDALLKRNASAYVNHSSYNNAQFEEDVNNRRCIINLVAVTPIKKGDQVLANYGPHYFTNIKPKGIHAKDNWRQPNDNYAAAKEQFIPGIYELDVSILEKFGLSSEKNLYVVPALCKAIIEDDFKCAKALLAKKETDPNLPLYEVKFDQGAWLLKEASEQERITPLMLAAMLGKVEMVKLLLQHKEAVIDIPTHTMNNNPLHWALKGFGNKKQKRQMVELFVDHDCYIDITNNNEEGILSLCLSENLPNVIEYLVKKIPFQQKRLLIQLLIDGCEEALQCTDPYSYCIQEKKWDLFVLLCQFTKRDVSTIKFLKENKKLQSTLDKNPAYRQKFDAFFKPQHKRKHNSTQASPLIKHSLLNQANARPLATTPRLHRRTQSTKKVCSYVHK